MPVQRPPRPPPVLASVLAAAGVVLAVASCAGHITPLGPDQAATMPQPGIKLSSFSACWSRLADGGCFPTIQIQAGPHTMTAAGPFRPRRPPRPGRYTGR